MTMTNQQTRPSCEARHLRAMASEEVFRSEMEIIGELGDGELLLGNCPDCHTTRSFTLKEIP